MSIVSLQIENLRVLRQVAIAPSAGINFITGVNGAGKTSILEAIYLAGRGRTFRHPDAGPLIRHGEDNATVVVRLGDVGSSGSTVLGVRRGRKELVCRINGQEVQRRSTLAETLPVQWIGSQPQLLISMGPEIRRRFIDMGVFHVEQGFLETMAGFQRVLRQRNAALRVGNRREVTLWDKPLSEVGTQLAEQRARFVRSLMPVVGSVLKEWNLDLPVTHRYRQGWKEGVPLLEELVRRLDADRQLGYTHAGPQRADLVLAVDGHPVEKTLSRGQQKMLVLAMNLAMADLVTQSDSVAVDGEKRLPVMLIDDLAAELDRDNRNLVLRSIERKGNQAYITTIDPRLCEDAPVDSPKVFHVEHGSIA